MLGRLTANLLVLVFAFAILGISILRAGSLSYSFNGPANPTPAGVSAVLRDSIDYSLPYPGPILPDHPLWFLKASRDKLWLLVTTDPAKKAELKLLMADKRLAISKILFERGKPELGFTTMLKADKYLDEAYKLEKENREQGMNTSEFLQKLAHATLMHRFVSMEIMQIAPEDAKPGLVKCQNHIDELHKSIATEMVFRNLPVPENPFEGEK